jgi:hypothetical protein
MRTIPALHNDSPRTHKAVRRRLAHTAFCAEIRFAKFG